MGYATPTATNIATANTVCASTSGPLSQLDGADLGSVHGNVVWIPCNSPVDGKIVSVQIMWVQPEAFRSILKALAARAIYCHFRGIA